MYFDEHERAKMALESVNLAVLRLFSLAPKTRVAAKVELEEAIARLESPEHQAKHPPHADCAVMLPVLKAIHEAMIADMEHDTQVALQHLGHKILKGLKTEDDDMPN